MWMTGAWVPPLTIAEEKQRLAVSAMVFAEARFKKKILSR